jgi:hypothetical protein
MAAKIGVSQASSDRIETHLGYGWKVSKLWSFQNGEKAACAEAIVLSHFRKTLKLPPFLRPRDMPQGGFTETVSESAISIEEISKLLNVNSSDSPDLPQGRQQKEKPPKQ